MATRTDRSGEGHELAPLVAELLSSLKHEGGKVSLPAKDFSSFEARFKAVPGPDREQTLVDLVAAAVKLKRLGGAAATDAIVSFADLAGVLDGRARAEAAFGAQGLVTRAQRSAIGGAEKLTAPAAEEKPKGPAPKPKRGLR